jgi:hypothetical protein
MPQFTVIPRFVPKSAIVTNRDQVFSAVSRMCCEDADVLCDGEYAFSIHRGGEGMWILSGRRGH